VRNCFDVRWNYFSMNTPQVLQAISAKLFTREQAKATVQWNEIWRKSGTGGASYADRCWRRVSFILGARYNARVRFPEADVA
jgi:hypothetical protein